MREYKVNTPLSLRTIARDGAAIRTPQKREDTGEVHDFAA